MIKRDDENHPFLFGTFKANEILTKLRKIIYTANQQVGTLENIRHYLVIRNGYIRTNFMPKSVVHENKDSRSRVAKQKDHRELHYVNKKQGNCFCN